MVCEQCIRGAGALCFVASCVVRSFLHCGCAVDIPSAGAVGDFHGGSPCLLYLALALPTPTLARFCYSLWTRFSVARLALVARPPQCAVSLGFCLV